MVLTQNYDTEQLKRMLTERSNKFELRPSRKRFATYEILYYKCDIWRSFKMDILTPGIMNIPNIPSSRNPRINGLPAMSFMPLLLLKLQAWEDHRKSDRTDYRMKQYTDARDIKELLPIAAQRGEHKRDAGWLSPYFLSMADDRIQRFILSEGDAGRGSTRMAWQKIGF